MTRLKSPAACAFFSPIHAAAKIIRQGALVNRFGGAHCNWPFGDCGRRLADQIGREPVRLFPGQTLREATAHRRDDSAKATQNQKSLRRRTSARRLSSCDPAEFEKAGLERRLKFRFLLTGRLPKVIGSPKRWRKSPKVFDFIGGPEGIRTPDLRFRKPLLYPAELRDRVAPL